MTYNKDKRKSPYQFILRLLSPDVTIIIFVIIAMMYKIIIMQPVATGPIFLAIIQHDSPVIAIIILFYAAGVITNRRSETRMIILGKITQILLLLVVLLYACDVFAYYFFTTRLYASDIITFSSEFESVILLARTGLRTMLGSIGWEFSLKILLMTIIFILLSRSFYVILLRRLQPKLHKWYLVGTIVLLLGFYFVPVPGYVYSFGDKPLYENFIERNANYFNQSNFSDSFRNKLLNDSLPTKLVTSGRHQHLNVILLIVESLSAYHSRFFSGLNDWTPRIDEIAQKETGLTNFHANGWTTIGGLISLLGHTFPFVPEQAKFNEWGSPRLTDFLNIKRPIAKVLSQQGYSTVFIAAGDLSFLGQDVWLKDVGFEKIIGNDDPRFAGQKIRGPFKSVPDKLLYEVSLDEISKISDDKPYFMTIQTYWSHRPFMTSDGSKLPGEEQVIRETDYEIGLLYNRLMISDFFNNGLLFITGDHRAMEPFKKDEMDRFGSSARTRIPAIIITHAINLPRVISQDFQQRDFSVSIESLISQEFNITPYEGVFLTDPSIPSRCIMHARGDSRDLIFVKCGNQEGTVLVSGDSTRLANGAIDNEVDVIRTINLTRMRKD